MIVNLKENFTFPKQCKVYHQPNDEGFKKEKHFQYSTFPLKLNDQYFSRPRLEFLNHKNPFQVHYFPKTQIDILRFDQAHIYKQWFRHLVKSDQRRQSRTNGFGLSQHEFVEKNEIEQIVN
ncbi:unnamed protein product (macronuclear) [Paramecium tetraurelia]|uniref:Uncharacterized protein n=1 Tax=Paramecium tetraurelia TaxID=5888 RepID=A0E0G2_PARTE|nr:uncharacterized protein GSPATT00021947001 [Paramecium tetraurelia]CAK88779.1 unnamed protein product [Paramecium tetraurelia]|eukprot:XP_001456176.1 hypothetical protein (macronuclear) [Paramecium tetraurelia strain d4-2]